MKIGNKGMMRGEGIVFVMRIRDTGRGELASFN